MAGDDADADEGDGAASATTPLGEGVYSLVLAVDGAPEAALAIEVGALGTLRLERPAYVYVGSARGPGGFARIDRHRALARGERDVRRWHVDYVIGHEAVDVAAVVRSDGEECAVARRHGEPPDGAVATAAAASGSDEDPHDVGVAAGETVPGFGASDCDCPGHLYGFATLDCAAATAVAAHDAVVRREAAWCNSYQDRDPLGD